MPIKRRKINETRRPARKQEIVNYEEEAPRNAKDVEDEILKDNPYRRMGSGDIEAANNMAADNPCCPIVFVDSSIIGSPSPFDLAIKNAHDQIEQFLRYFDTHKDLQNSLKGLSSRLKEIAIHTISDTYGNSLTGLAESYFEQYLVPKFVIEINNNGDTACIIKDYITRVSEAGVGYLEYMIRDWWTIWDNSNLCTDEEANRLCYLELESIKTTIADRFANALTRLARQISFGELIYLGNDNRFDSISEDIRDILIKEANGGEPMTAQDFYWVQLSEYTLLLDGLMPMIEVLLNQCYATFRYLFFDSGNNEVPFR